MIIKKYKAKTEKEAILMAQEDLGPGAIVMNVKTIKPNGIMKLFRRIRVELTAAIDDNIADRASNDTSSQVKKTEESIYHFGTGFSEKKDDDNEAAKNAIEEKINSIAKLLEKQMTITPKDEPVKEKEIIDTEKEIEHPSTQNKIAELIHKQLVNNEVKEKYADMLVEELNDVGGKQTVDNALANTYQKIVLKLGEVKPIQTEENKPKVIFFVGNTGVGKTTTMAKLASKCKLEDKMSVAMFSVDTYRIAAIEQTKTYANILNAPMEVIYTPEDMKKYVDKHKECDLIMVDTAGRSHRNEEQRKDLKAIIDSVSDYDSEILLVLSATIKYSDLFDIADTYSKMFDFCIIFTKLDETCGLGNILNLKLDTGKELSYVTWGQNVPDDIGLINPQTIAKKLLGGVS